MVIWGRDKVGQGRMVEESSVGWRMVWELKSAAIVMLTQLQEDGEVSGYGNFQELSALNSAPGA